jgi:hypothetical protein
MKAILKQLLILHAMIFACMAVCAAVYFIPSTIYCEQRKIPPTAPVYPGSTLTDTSYFLVGLDYSFWPPKFLDVDEPGMSLATYHYTVAASPEQVIEFYTETEGASVAPNRYVVGNAEPFGEFDVGIHNPNSQTDHRTTEYFIEIRWQRCQ